MAAMREFETGGSWSAEEWLWEEGARSRETERQRSRALNWRRGEYAQFLAREQASRRRGEDGRERRAETAWSDVVWAWPRRRATETASSRARAASGVRHWRAAATGVGMGSESEGRV